MGGGSGTACHSSGIEGAKKGKHFGFFDFLGGGRGGKRCQSNVGRLLKLLSNLESYSGNGWAE